MTSQAPPVLTDAEIEAQLREYALYLRHKHLGVDAGRVETAADRLASLSAQVEKLQSVIKGDVEFISQRNAQVEALTKERDELRGEVADLIEDGNDLRGELRHYQREYGRLEAQVEVLSRALAECADALEASVNAEYVGTLDYPSMMRKFERDMQPVVHARAALNTNAPAPAEREKALEEAAKLAEDWATKLPEGGSYLVANAVGHDLARAIRAISRPKEG